MSAKRSASTVSHKLPKSHAKSAKRPKLETSAIPKQYEQHVKLDAKKSIVRDLQIIQSNNYTKRDVDFSTKA